MKVVGIQMMATSGRIAENSERAFALLQQACRLYRPEVVLLPEACAAYRAAPDMAALRRPSQSGSLRGR